MIIKQNIRDFEATHIRFRTVKSFRYKCAIDMFLVRTNHSKVLSKHNLLSELKLFSL